MSDKRSMTRRLAIALTGIVALFWFVALGLGVYVMQDEFTEIFDSGVQETAERLLQVIADDVARDAADGAPKASVVAPALNAQYLTYQVRDRDGRVLFDDGAPEPFAVPLATGFSQTATHRIFTAGTTDGSLYVQVADAMEHRTEALMEGGTALLLPLLVLIPGSILAIVFVVRSTLSPVSQLRDDILTKDSGNLAPIDEATLPRELRAIARSVNLLLARLKAGLEAEREFTSNSAHELRTPIAGALAQTQRLAREVPPEYQPRTAQIERALVHLSRLAEKLLQMSRAEAEIAISDEQHDLLPVLMVVMQDLERSALGANRLNVHVAKGTVLERPIRVDAFAIVLRNLLENALIHSPPGSRVDLHVDPMGIRVTNESAVVAADVRANLTKRFVRGPTEASGSGLGLAIVERLVEQMQGELRIASPARGKTQGFEVEVRL
ncbi:sensor histidine kinase N-terminal domain-containing protein (plasmid) [Ensifer sp. PDNC004]|uniref:sensor histidine kinase n=1 Tax=Ensifer sp. PDNC004 TaxID=2811423 RepID=UPI0019644C2E|nr:ATP-binding protein [Ensifer sp. PDNC004]QRY65570.1 sensor histidine kinase N-terminal domain-containing protein [Ensifer sp. PDNC004]